MVIEVIGALYLTIWLKEFWYQTVAFQPAGSNHRHH